MNIDMEITAKLSAEDVNNIIKEYLIKNGYDGYEIIGIKPLVSTRSIGHQMFEETETVFNGIEAKIKKIENVDKEAEHFAKPYTYADR